MQLLEKKNDSLLAAEDCIIAWKYMPIFSFHEFDPEVSYIS